MVRKVLLTEKRWLEVEVDADSDIGALEAVQEMYGGGMVNLDAYSGACVRCDASCGDAEMKIGSWEA